jgi:hypothetical protein
MERRIKIYVQAHGFDVLQSIVDGYKNPATPSTYDNQSK